MAVIFCTESWLIEFNGLQLNVPCKFEKVNQQLVYYSIYYNMTLGFQIPYFKLKQEFPINYLVISLKKSIDEAIIRYFNQEKGFEMKIGVQSFPAIENYFLRNIDFVSIVGSFLFFIPIAFSFLIITNQLIFEKTSQMKIFLTIYGQTTLAHVVSWTAFALFLSILSCIITLVTMAFVQNEIIRNVPFWFWAVFFFSILVSFNLLGILIVSVVSTSQASYTVAYSFMLFSFVFQGFMCGPQGINYYYENQTLSKVLRVIFDFYPGYNYIKIFADLVYFSGSRFDIDSRTYVSGQPLKWSDLFVDYTKSSFDEKLFIPGIYSSFIYISRNIVLYYVLIFLFEKVLPSNRGSSLFSFTRKVSSEQSLKSLDDSVTYEKERVKAMILE